MCSCYFYFENLICRKAAVDGYFISPRYSELEGNIHTYDELIPIDYDELTEKAEQEAKHGIENRIRKEAEERKTVADFKARTEELFHGINGQTQEDIELSVYAYLQSKIDEYE